MLRQESRFAISSAYSEFGNQAGTNMKPRYIPADEDHNDFLAAEIVNAWGECLQNLRERLGGHALEFFALKAWLEDDGKVGYEHVYGLKNQ